jgi:hypothetical protein
MGADVKAGVTSDLTLTATINPDFGQVESDPSVVNLTAFESFFPERRPFFVEGVDIFRFGIGLGDGDLGNESLFYSRRIGRAPQGGERRLRPTKPGRHHDPGGGQAVGEDRGRLVHRRAGRPDLHGIRRFVLDGVEGEVPVEPLTNYAVARVMKDFRAGKSAVGGIFTATHRSSRRRATWTGSAAPPTPAGWISGTASPPTATSSAGRWSPAR